MHMILKQRNKRNTWRSILRKADKPVLPLQTLSVLILIVCPPCISAIEKQVELHFSYRKTKSIVDYNTESKPPLNPSLPLFHNKLSKFHNVGEGILEALEQKSWSLWRFEFPAWNYKFSNKFKIWRPWRKYARFINLSNPVYQSIS